MDFVKVNNSLDNFYESINSIYMKINNLEVTTQLLESVKYTYFDNELHGIGKDVFNDLICILDKLIDDFLNCKDNLKELTDKAWSEYIEINKEIQMVRNDVNVKSV